MHLRILSSTARIWLRAPVFGVVSIGTARFEIDFLPSHQQHSLTSHWIFWDSSRKLGHLRLEDSSYKITCNLSFSFDSCDAATLPLFVSVRFFKDEWNQRNAQPPYSRHHSMVDYLIYCSLDRLCVSQVRGSLSFTMIRFVLNILSTDAHPLAE